MSAGDSPTSGVGKAPLCWNLQSDSEHANCRVFDVRKRHFVHPTTGKAGDFFVLDSADWVNVVPVTPRGEIVLVRQFRFGTRALSWEVPGGIIDAGEDPVKAGVRELLEETGWRAGRAERIAFCRPNPAILNNRCHVVLATDLVYEGTTEWDEHEDIEVGVFSEDVVWAMVGRMEIQHSLALNALFFHRMHREGALTEGS